jgi:demethylmenaquinone methyltransferase/2-methoxy-6-polyprenyl-1,4-benzoquinol methylase
MKDITADKVAGNVRKDGSARAIVGCFTRIASRYDVLNRVLSFGRDKAWRELIIGRARNRARVRNGRWGQSDRREGPAVLDVCTGTGDMALLFAGEEWAGFTTGVDLSPSMLDIARRKMTRQNLGNRVHFKTADALALPCSREQFDIVTICFGLRNLTDREAGIRELFRVLKTEGSLFILEFAPRQRGLTGFLYRLYLTMAVPLLGTLISGAPDAYRYLSDSIQAFLEPEEVGMMLYRLGGIRVRAVPLTYGVVYLYSCRKGEPGRDQENFYRKKC